MTDTQVQVQLAEADRLFADSLRAHETTILLHPGFDGDVDEIDRLVGQCRARWLIIRAELIAKMRACVTDAARES